MASYPFAGSSAQLGANASQPYTPGTPASRSYSPSQPLMPAPGSTGRGGDRPSSPSSFFSAQSGRRSQEDIESVQKNPFGDRESNGIADKFNLAPDPNQWGHQISADFHEFDDYLHAPDKTDDLGSIWTARGLANLGCIAFLAVTLIALFAVFPIVSFLLTKPESNLGGYNLGGINSTGQVMETTFAMIDAQTPQNAQTYVSAEDGSPWQLVFSDEFNSDGRTFYPGDDPFWEAVDLHYWGTNNLEWYDPQQLTTKDGHLVITLDKTPNHELDYMGGMMSTWNKFCFTGGIIVTSVTLPSKSSIYGLWPAVWAMGNLGRAGYGASLDGMWPYTYDACDIGTLANQTQNGGPDAALTTGEGQYGGELSFLPGQRLSACTCPGEPHPGPIKSDGSFAGRAAPEIDIFEALVNVDTLRGQVSQSSQWAPYNAYYVWENTTYATIYDPTVTTLNEYRGGVYQQTTSALSSTNQDCYELDTGCSTIYGFEYKPGYAADNAYITWINDGKKVWRVDAAGVGADPLTKISARPVPQEPMYIIANLGMSPNFGEIDFNNLEFPTHMLIDWIRVYQHPDRINIGCDPPNFPTSNYIERYIEAYTNPNLTTWVNDYGEPLPKNSLVENC